MTIEELLEQINRALKAGRLSATDSVFIRNTAVSEDAMSAGSSGWAEPTGVLVIGGNRESMEPGIYLELEGDY